MGLWEAAYVHNVQVVNRREDKNEERERAGVMGLWETAYVCNV